MIQPEAAVIGLATALGAGLLVGIERERRKGAGPGRSIAGVRTFALAALGGAAATLLGQPLVMAAGALLITALASIAYWRDRSKDPGVTTELALLVTYLVGAIAIDHPMLAGGTAVVVAALLAGRERLHEFSVDTLTETELRDGLVFAAAALILLPLVPNTPIAWAAGANPRRLWSLVVLFMGLQAAGYIAVRAAGARLGLAVSGLAAGFVSSTGTIAALGARTRTTPALLRSAVAGALFSCVATLVLLVIVVVAVYPPALPGLAAPCAAALVAALAAAFVALARQVARSRTAVPAGRAFNLLHALGFTAVLTAVSVAVAEAERHLGSGAATLATALAGTFDVHAAAASTLSRAAAGALSPDAVRLPVLLALSTNSCAKLVAAVLSGGVRYGAEVGTGLALIVLAAWAPYLVATGWIR